MPAKSTSPRATPKSAVKPARATAAKPRAKSPRMSKSEAEALASFKALMKEYGGKLKFAGCDE